MIPSMLPPSWQSLLKAIALAAAMASALDFLIQFWRTPLGWSASMVVGLLAVGALIGFSIGAAVGLSVGLPVGRLLARRGHFRPTVLTVGGALLGVAIAMAASALGNTYRFMSGPGFWQSFMVSGFAGGLVGYLWFKFWSGEMAKSARTNV